MITVLGSLHLIYLTFIIIILLFMIFKRDISLICILGILVLGFAATKSVPSSISALFNSFIYAIKELLPTILIISIIVGMGVILEKTGINEALIYPFTRLIKSPSLAYWIIGILMMIISWFFWPSPAVALIGAILVPAALKVGLPALGAAMAMNLFGHGIALSSDFVIQGAPKLTADGAGIAVSEVTHATIPLIIVMGLVTTITAFIILRKDMKKGLLSVDSYEPQSIDIKSQLTSLEKKIFAIGIAIFFAIDIYIMIKLNLQGGDATALVGGTSLIILSIITIYTFKEEGLSNITSFIVEGLQFGFRVFGPVIPIAAFFYLGDEGFLKIIGDFLPQGSAGLVNDLGAALSQSVPLTPVLGASTLSIVGAITGLDGSGFSGISLAGSIAKIFGTSIGHGTATLTALGQITGIWVGGGTLIPWALIPVAAICKVDPFELARRNLVPVVIGILATTIAAVFLL